MTNRDTPDKLTRTEAPLTLRACEACDGSGVLRKNISVYETGCGLSHDDVDERPCPECLGLGDILDEVEGAAA